MTGPWTLRLTYPRLPLSLNARPNRWALADSKKTLRDQVRWLCRQQHIPRLDAIHVDVVFYPKVVRVRDADNLGLALKVIVDGTRDAPARRTRNGLIPAYVGIVADDDPAHVTSSAAWGPVVADLEQRLVVTISEGLRVPCPGNLALCGVPCGCGGRNASHYPGGVA